ncbi:retrovirus-related pol polyprotein from transposon TNT 1-94 [Tanacetum coccineum]
MNMLNGNCKTSFAKPECLKKAQRANPHLYDIGCYNDNLALMLAPESDETIRLANESRSKLSDLIRPFHYDQLNNLYDLFVPECEKSLEQQYFSKESKMSHTSANNEISKESFNKQTTLLEKRMDESILWDQKEYYYADHMNAILGVYTEMDEVTNLQCDYLEALEKCERLEKELSKSRTMSKSFEALQKHAINLELALQQSQLQDKGIAISELKKLIEKMKGKSVETKFEKSSVIRQPNAFKSQRQSILGKPATFSDSLAKTDFSKSKSVTTNNVSNDFSKPVTAQILPQNVMTILKNTNVIAPGMYKVHTKPNQTRTPQLPQDIRKTNKRVSFSTGVIPTTSVSRPQLKSNQLEDRVMPNNSQGKKQEVEDHRRNFKFSNNKTSVNFVCVTCGKCVLNDNHDMCVLHYINGVNSRTKMPMAVPISTREPKRTMNQSVATPLKRIVALESTNQKPRHTTRKLYEHVLMAQNFDTINLLSKNDIVIGLPKLKFVKDHLCSSCELGKAKRKSFHTKTTPSSKRRLQLLHMDLCGPMRVESINGKKYVLVIVDDYSRYTWTHFLRSKDETPEVLIDFLRLVQRGLHAQVRTVRTDKGTKFLNKTLHAYFAQEGIEHQTSTARTPEQNGVVERRNRTLVEAARTMLSAAKVPLYFWTEAIATTCFTQNRSLVIPRHEKTPYHIINGRKPSVNFFYIFGSLCYIVRDGENLDKMKEKGDACIFMALDHVSSDTVPQCQITALEHDSLSPNPHCHENVPQPAETVTTSNKLDLLFNPMFDEL